MTGGAAASPPLREPRVLHLLVDVVLRRRQMGNGAYVAVAAACTVVPAVTLGALIYVAAAAAGQAPASGPMPRSAGELLVYALGLVVFAPLVETAVLAGMVALVRGVTRRPPWLVGGPALLWGLAHGIFTSGWIDFGGRVMATTWAFVVFTTVYVVWSREGRGRGFWMSAAVHAANNAVVVLFLALWMAMGWT